MSVDTIRVDPEPSSGSAPGAIDITGVSIRKLERILRGTSDVDTDDVFLERRGGRTYLVAREQRAHLVAREGPK